jgi:eukaryotic-like serine/threonine-protein kinase
MIGAETEELPVGSELVPGYTVLRLGSRGSLFDVYEVWSVTRHCRCAAKVLRPHRRAEPKGRRRLLREGRVLMGLSHPSIVRAYELRNRPEPVLIMEALPGMTVEYWLEQQGRLTTSNLVHLGDHLTSAVAYLHTQRILHLDLKPGNLVASGGIVRVIDFSLARAPGRGRAGMGTHIYLAPEQALGRMLGPAADVWGIGVVLWEAATGHPPFEYPDDHEVYDQLLRRATSVRRSRRLPRGLADGIDACLEPEPAQRPTVRELAELFDSLL